MPAAKTRVFLLFIYKKCCLAQAVRLNLPAMLFQRALRCPTAPSAAGAVSMGLQDNLACALATALADLLVMRGGNELTAAALPILFDPRLAAWYGATAAEASRPPRVRATAQRLLINLHICPSGSLGVRTLPPHRRSLPLASPAFLWTQLMRV